MNLRRQNTATMKNASITGKRNRLIRAMSTVALLTLAGCGGSETTPDGAAAQPSSVPGTKIAPTTDRQPEVPPRVETTSATSATSPPSTSPAVSAWRSRFAARDSFYAAFEAAAWSLDPSVFTGDAVIAGELLSQQLGIDPCGLLTDDDVANAYGGTMRPAGKNRYLLVVGAPPGLSCNWQTDGTVNDLYGIAAVRLVPYTTFDGIRATYGNAFISSGFDDRVLAFDTDPFDADPAFNAFILIIEDVVIRVTSCGGGNAIPAGTDSATCVSALRALLDTIIRKVEDPTFELGAPPPAPSVPSVTAAAAPMADCVSADFFDFEVPGPDPQVATFQRALIAAGADIDADGYFGTATWMAAESNWNNAGSPEDELFPDIVVVSRPMFERLGIACQ